MANPHTSRLYHSAAQILKVWLEQQGAVQTWDEPTPGQLAPCEGCAFVSALPSVNSGPVKVLALTDTSPSKDGRLMSGENVFRWGVQLRFRDLSHLDIVRWVHSVIALFESTVFPVTVSGMDPTEEAEEAVAGDSVSYSISNIEIVSGPFPLPLQADGDKYTYQTTLNVLVAGVQSTLSTSR